MTLGKPKIIDLQDQIDIIDTSLDESQNQFNIQSNFVNVVDKGAKLDGTDDTQALINAITSANNSVTPIGSGGWKRVIYVPGQMTIRSADKIILPQGIKICGNDFNNCAIKFTEATGGFYVDRKDSNGNDVTTFELHFDNITLGGENTCQTILEAHRLANFRCNNVIIGGTTDYPFKIYNSGLVWFDNCTLDGSYGVGNKIRTQKGMYFEDCGMVVNDRWNLWNLKNGFNLAGYNAMFNLSKGSWVEEVETLIEIYPNSTTKNITSLNITVNESYILNCSASVYSWNLINFNFNSSPLSQVGDIIINVNNIKIYNNTNTTFKNNCVVYMNNFSGTAYYNVNKVNFAGITKPTNSVFVGMDADLQSSSWKVRFKEFTAVTQFKVSESATVNNYAIGDVISRGEYTRPIVPRGMKIWNDMNDNITGVIMYDNTPKTAVIYAGATAGTDYRYLVNVRTGSGVATFNPEFTGQVYVDTTNKVVYIATGTGSTNEWKQVTN